MLFKLGHFTSAAGLDLAWKIECNALDADDWACVAAVMMPALPPFHEVTGVPTGGFPLALACRSYRTENAPAILVVDDVWTTGKSMRAHVARFSQWVGLVAFARGELPDNVVCFAKLSESLLQRVPRH